jgi:homoserine O-acetyltransferase
MDALVPMASQPTSMGSRNWMMRRLIIDAIRNDPAWNNGNYTEQPPAVRIASVFFDIATNNGSQALAKTAPTRLEADKFLDERLARPFTADANDLLYLWDSSRDYDASADLENIRAAVLAINSADDERYPAETGILERALKRVKNGNLHLIPASTETRGHGTTGMARFWKHEVAKWLETVPRRTA